MLITFSNQTLSYKQGELNLSKNEIQRKFLLFVHNKLIIELIWVRENHLSETKLIFKLRILF